MLFVAQLYNYKRKVFYIEIIFCQFSNIISHIIVQVNPDIIIRKFSIIKGR